MKKLILASSSPFRRELLSRLGLPFDWASPQADEAPHPDEHPQQLAMRLAQTKAQSVAGDYPNALIIGSDQVAVIGDEMIGKPGSYKKAVDILSMASGQVMKFYTAVCVLNGTTGKTQLDVVPFSVRFRQLDNKAITNYVSREQPYNCAGAFKSEGLGIVLLESMHGDDPTALIGLPLIRLTQMLEQEGISILQGDYQGQTVIE